MLNNHFIKKKYEKKSVENYFFDDVDMIKIINRRNYDQVGSKW